MRNSSRFGAVGCGIFLVVGAGVAGCGDNGTGSASATQTGTTSQTSAPTSTSEGTSAVTDSGTTAGGSGSASETMSPTTTGEPTSTTSPTGTSTTTGTTGSVDPSTSGEPGSSGGTTVGPKQDMGPPVCPPDQTPSTFDFIWIANTSQGTVSKINTMTGVEEGRYYVSPTPGTGQSSRTSVNQWGDVAVSNREPASVTKVAALEQKCVDKNGNGVIETSTGPNDIKPWGQDECVLWHTPLPLAAGFGGGARPTAWEGVAQDPVTCEMPVPRLWIGYKDAQGTAHFARLHGDTGAIVDEATRPNWNANSFGPYGGAVNSAGDLFVIGYDSEVSVRVDALTLQVEELGLSPGAYKYGMGVDKNGNMWVGSFFGEHHMYHYDAQAKTWQGMGNGGNPNNYGALGVAVDDENRVWGACSSPCRLIELDGNTKTWTNQNIALPGCGSPWGVSIDNEGYVWVVDKANQAFKVDPDTYEVKLIVKGLINPYTYSDMTGQGLKLVLPQ
jgi:streptogramin lyase